MSHLNSGVCGPPRGPQLFGDKIMYVCYVDESGDSGTLQISDINSNPFFIITGLIIKHTRLIPLTHNFLKIKTRFFPKHFTSATMGLDIYTQSPV